MNTRRQDFQLLQSFARHGQQAAFADVVRRHLDLVFATALRKLQDPDAAQEVAQNVFISLARKAWQFAPDDSLAAWLHKATLLESKSWLRAELRRRRREDTAAQLGTTMRTPEDQPACQALVPLLDEALLALRETERTALLLRYYESHSVRDIAAALGVSEAAAQKRIERALDKVSRFFQQRGFKTASVATTVAALTATSASASPATTAAVLNAVLHAAPAALAGWSATMARAVGWSKAQTAPVCLAIAIVPLAWQIDRVRVVKRDVAAARANLAALRTQQEDAAVETERLRAESRRVEGVRLRAALAQAKEKEAAQKLATLKARSRALLAADDYRWPDDLPFVRIPKAALPSIKMGVGPDTPARLQSKVAQFLDLAPPERQAANLAFTNYYARIEELLTANVYETNQALSLKLPAGAQSTVFVLEPLGPKICAALDLLCADLSAILGQDRWAMVQPQTFEFTHSEQVRLLGYARFAWDQRQELALNLFAHPGAEPTVSWAAADGTGSGPVPLRFLMSHPPFLPQEAPLLMDNVKRWLAAQAAAHLPNPVTK